MAGKFNLKSGTEYLPKYNWELGMNDDLAYSDRAGWTTSTEMLCGGVGMEWDDLGALEVGNQYDLDPMSEERGKTTFSDGVPTAMGHIGIMAAEGAPGMQMTERTVGGKNVDLSSPQTYNKIDANKYKG
jgi:hypothetical protein